MQLHLIPAARRDDWYARALGGATEHARERAAREINAGTDGPTAGEWVGISGRRYEMKFPLHGRLRFQTHTINALILSRARASQYNLRPHG